MPTMPPRSPRAASRARPPSTPSLLKPSRLITASSASSRNRRGRGLPGCGRGVTVPTSTKPKPSRSSGSGTSAFLSKPAASPTGLGNVRPNASHAQLLVVRAPARQRRKLERIEREPRAPSPDRALRSSGRASRSNSAITARAPETRAARPRRAAAASPSAPPTAAARHRDAETARRRARAPSAARRRAPPRRPPPGRGRSCPAKCRAAVSRHLRGGGEMDEAVRAVDRRAGEYAGALGLAPERPRANLVDGGRQARASGGARPYRRRLCAGHSSASLPNVWTNRVFIPT